MQRERWRSRVGGQAYLHVVAAMRPVLAQRTHHGVQPGMGHRERGELSRYSGVEPRCRLLPDCGQLAAEFPDPGGQLTRPEEQTSELQSRQYLGCRLLLEEKNTA